MKRHEHADLIIAWANGAEIEYLDINLRGEDVWILKRKPGWYTGVKYRIKPKKKEKKLVPFGKDDVRGLIGKIISCKEEGNKYMITGASKGDGWPLVLFGGDFGHEWCPVADLLDGYEFEDGSPCGKYIEE